MVTSNFFAITAANLVTRSYDGLGISSFIVYSLFVLAVLPSGFVQGPMQQLYGRKTTSISSMISTGICAITLALVMMWDRNASLYVKISFAMVARFCCTVAWQSIAQLGTELIPASVRSRGLAMRYVIVNMGAFITPYIQHLELYFNALPRIVVAVFMLIGAYLCLQLPETRGKVLPISLAEGDQFGQGEGMFDFMKEIRQRRKREKNNMSTNQQADALENLMTSSKS